MVFKVGESCQVRPCMRNNHGVITPKRSMCLVRRAGQGNRAGGNERMTVMLDNRTGSAGKLLVSGWLELWAQELHDAIYALFVQ